MITTKKLYTWMIQKTERNEEEKMFFWNQPKTWQDNTIDNEI